MISNFKQFNEGINHLLVGPTKEEIWKSLGFDEPFDTPEEYLLYLIKDLKKITEYNMISFYNGNVELFRYSDFNKFLFCNQERIWKILEGVFGLKYLEIQSLIKRTISKQLGLTYYTPIRL